MNEYKYAESTVASGVTLLVSAWFLVAAGAILTDPASPYTARPVPVVTVENTANYTSLPVVTVENTANFMVADAGPAPRVQPVALVAAPNARFSLTVEAKRLKV